jgi:hypothetical protein
VALHGHVFDTRTAALALEIPLSDEETLFSTPDDRSAIVRLIQRYPYPLHRAWIRAGHGFVVVGEQVDETLATTLELAARARSLGLL